MEATSIAMGASMDTHYAVSYSEILRGLRLCALKLSLQKKVGKQYPYLVNFFARI